MDLRDAQVPIPLVGDPAKKTRVSMAHVIGAEG
jgi:hypothetical protein